MDEATEAFLTFMTDSIPSSRILWLFTYRPGYRHPFGERTYHTRIAVPALSSTGTVQIAQAMLGTEHLPEELRTLLIYAKGFFPELVYTFKHALTQDVAYNSLLVQQRQDTGAIGAGFRAENAV